MSNQIVPVKLTPQLERLVKNIREKVPTYGSPETAALAVRSDIEFFGAWSPHMEEELTLALAYVNHHWRKIEVLRGHSIIAKSEAWYAGPTLEDLHWPALQGYFENVKAWDKETIEAIDNTSTEIVSLLANPKRAQFTSRGLVVGYVQSGKTANMTAVIAKAVDQGYNLIVLLGGVTNKLRAQTQRRIEQDVVARHREHWQLYTTVSDDGDFVLPPNRQLTKPAIGGAQLVVMKKLTSRLEAFRKTVEGTPPGIMKDIKAIVIDDECDQASVNSSDKEFDMTAINEEIRKVIRALPSVTYVGYTATPFANVFIDPYPFNKDVLDDLYPSDFITALPQPKGYFGTKEVFGTTPVDAGNESEGEAGQDMVRIVPVDQLSKFVSSTAKLKAGFKPIVMGALEDAILWFLASSAIRRARGQADSHMTMLVHTSANVAPHNEMAKAIQGWIGRNKPGLVDDSSGINQRLRSVRDSELSRVSPLYDLIAEDTFRTSLLEVLAKLDVVIENGESLDRLDYYTGEAKTYIVVGGSILARGLTLEGLTVSFFLRSSRQYDSLLQMGRWFGYRPGYEDLPRLWTTSDLARDFRALAKIEDEIREDIQIYRTNKSITPLEFAVKVRRIPGMMITAKSKMRSVRPTSVSFEGRHVQTIHFRHTDSNFILGNWEAGSDLIKQITGYRSAKNGRLLFEDVPIDIIRKFLRSYQISESHLELSSQAIIAYVDGAAEGLKYWNVAVVEPRDTVFSAQSLGHDKVRTVSRAKLIDESKSYANIKALMSLSDISVDIDENLKKTESGSWEDLKAKRPPKPLLLLYPISAQSKARNTKTRENLDANGDLLGIGIVFPGSRDQSGSFMSLPLELPSVEQLENDDYEVAMIQDSVDE